MVASVSSVEMVLTLRFDLQGVESKIPPAGKSGHAGEASILLPGLELTICLRLVGMMGGRIGEESEPGKGSAF